MSKLFRWFIFHLKAHLHLLKNFFMWILPVCLNVKTLTLNMKHSANFLQNEMARLEKLKEFDISSWKAPDLKEVESFFDRILKTLLTSLLFFRNCRQVEILWVFACYVTQQDIADYRPAEIFLRNQIFIYYLLLLLFIYYYLLLFILFIIIYLLFIIF